MENTTIPDYEWNLWLEIMKEKGYDVLKYSKEIVLDFLIERGYLNEWLIHLIRDVTVISRGFSVEPSDQLTNRYSPSGVAVTVTFVPLS